VRYINLAILLDWILLFYVVNIQEIKRQNNWIIKVIVCVCVCVNWIIKVKDKLK